MHATDYLVARAKIDRDHQHRIQSLDDLWHVLNRNTPLPQPIDSHDDALASIRGGWQHVARQTIDMMPDDEEFTANDLCAAMQKTNPLLEIDKTQIWSFLRHQVRNKEIDVVVQGAGRRAAVYKKRSVEEMKKA